MSATFYNLTNMNNALKELYTNQVVHNMVYKNNPLLALMKKTTDFGGKYKPIPIVISTSQGRSATFSSAQGNQTGSNIQEFLLTRTSDYSIATIDNQTMLASKTDKMTFLNGSKLMIDSAFRSIINSVASGVYRTGTGTIGQIGSISTTGAGPYTTTIVLADPTTIVQFEIGMTLNSTLTDGGAASSDTLQVTKVNRNQTGTGAGSFEATSAASPSGTWAANSYLVVNGDLNLKPQGLQSWMPLAGVASNDSFFNVNRSVDSQRLAGVIYDGSSQTIEEAFIDHSAAISMNEGIPDHAFVTFQTYAALEKSLGSKVVYVDLKSNVGISFRGIEINGIKGPIKIIPDRNVPAQGEFLLQMENWCIEGLGDVPMILKYGDNLEMLRVGNADAGEVRIGAYYNVACNAPGYSGQGLLSA